MKFIAAMATRHLASPPELRQMVQCLELYYRQQKHQKEIAQALGLSSSKVSRLLKRAFEEGLIRVELDLPQNPRLGAALVERFGLRDAVVVDRKSTRLNSSHIQKSRMPSSA